jgi:hypothetical protein
MLSGLQQRTTSRDVHSDTALSNNQTMDVCTIPAQLTLPRPFTTWLALRETFV